MNLHLVGIRDDNFICKMVCRFYGGGQQIVVAPEPVTDPCDVAGGQFVTVIEAIPVTLRLITPRGTLTHPLFVLTLPALCMQLASDHKVTILDPVHEIAPASQLQAEHERSSVNDS